MNRYALRIQFDGTAYHGWQSQNNAVSVQSVIDEKISTALQEKIHVFGCGRTDTGVHAKDFILHFDTKKKLSTEIIYKINRMLPYDISVKKLYKVSADFNSRFDAKKRIYEYHLSLKKNPFTINKAWYFPQLLDFKLMNKAAKILMKHNDFKTFSKSRTQVQHYMCKIYSAEWKINNDDEAVFTIAADRFLRNMVRAIVGSLILVGQKKISVADFDDIIKKQNRKFAGESVPACGLYLTEVEYKKGVMGEME